MAHRAARPPALRVGPDPDDLPSHLVLAAFMRRNISFPAARAFRPGPCKRPHDTADEFSVRPSSAATPDPQSSAPLGTQRAWEDHPPPKPLPHQIPIDSQLLAAFPRVPSSEAFRRRPPVPGRLLAPGPASETLPDSSRSGDRDRTAGVDRGRGKTRHRRWAARRVFRGRDGRDAGWSIDACGSSEAIRS